MAVTLNSTGVTFSDATSQSTKATILGAVQATAYAGTYFRGAQAYQTTEFLGYAYGGLAGGGIFQTAGTPSTTVLCGFGLYRSGTTIAGPFATDSNNADAGLIQVRAYYRTIG